MARRDLDDSAPNLFDLGPDGRPQPEDTIEPAPHPNWWSTLQRRRTELAVVATAFVVAVVVAYLVGAAHDHSTSTGPSTAASTSADGAPSGSLLAPALTLVQTGAQCATQTGGQLELGIEVANRSAAALQLTSVDPVLPLGGLRADVESLGACGQVGPAPAAAGASIAAGATAWISSVFDVLETCPQALPVQFAIDYLQGSRAARVTLGGFSDLGGVSYSGCAAGP